MSGQQVADYLGRGDDAALVALAGQHVEIVTAFVAAYTRDRGFTLGEPGADVEAVIVSATARLSNNPAGTVSEAVGPYQHRPAVLDGFTLPELAVLHRHRRRAA